MSGAEDVTTSEAPKRCGYCDGTDPNCGFCEMGVPLDTQADWDASWGKVLDHYRADNPPPWINRHRNG